MDDKDKLIREAAIRTLWAMIRTHPTASQNDHKNFYFGIMSMLHLGASLDEIERISRNDFAPSSYKKGLDLLTRDFLDNHSRELKKLLN